MKATLTIEVPDDFEKGDYKHCPYCKRVQHAHGDEDTYDCYAEITFIKRVHKCEADNCPLEIQHTCANCGNNKNTAVNHGRMNPRCDFSNCTLADNDYCSWWVELEDIPMEYFENGGV